jgi:hypothetical protein
VLRHLLLGLEFDQQGTIRCKQIVCFYMQFNHSKRTSKPTNKKGKVENTLTYKATKYQPLNLNPGGFSLKNISLMSSQERVYVTHFSLISFKVYAIHKACTVMESPLQNITKHHICTLNIYLDNYSGCKWKRSF